MRSSHQARNASISSALISAMGLSPTMSKKLRMAYRDALAALKDIAKGLIKLDAATVAPVTTGGTGAMITDRERPFTEANMKGFI